MSESTNRDLVRAYDLIEADRNDEARVILDAYLASNKENPDAWWLYAYAVSNPQDAQRALENVIRLKPDYPGAKELLSETQEAARRQPAGTTTTISTPTSGSITRLGSKPSAQPVPDFLDRLDDEDDDEDLDLDGFADDDELDDDLDDFNDDELEEEGERREPSRLLIYAGIVVVTLLVVAAVAGLFLSNRRGTPDATATSVADIQTTQDATTTAVFNVNPTTDVIPVESPEVSVGNDFVDIYTVLSDVDVVEASAGVEATTAGQTFLVSVCSGAGRQQLSETLTTVMPLIAGEADSLTTAAEAVGVRLVDCTNGERVLRTVYVTSQDAEEFAAGTITADELRRRWKSL